MLDTIVKIPNIGVGSIPKRLPAANAITGTMIILIGVTPTASRASFSIDCAANFFRTIETFWLPDVSIFNIFCCNESFLTSI